MDFPGKIDDELCKNLIENQDILLSSNMNDNNDLSFDLFSNILTETGDQVLSGSEQSFHDEIMDSDLFEFLRTEDPDVQSLLDSLSGNSEFKANFLPQISVNTTNKVLDEVTSNQGVEEAGYNKKKDKTQYSIINLENVLKREVQSPPSQELEIDISDSVTPSRVSSRIKKRNTKFIHVKEKVITTLPKKEPKRLNSNGTKQRKVSVDIDESGSLFSNENSSDNNTYKANSIDYESDEHIYFDDDDFAPHSNEDSNEREFQQFVMNYNQEHKLQLDPTKKDANKEAATRYRLKKLSEKDRIFETRLKLENENSEVKRRCELVQTEINYLKNLLVQMLLVKGFIGDKLTL